MMKIVHAIECRSDEADLIALSSAGPANEEKRKPQMVFLDNRMVYDILPLPTGSL